MQALAVDQNELIEQKEADTADSKQQSDCELQSPSLYKVETMRPFGAMVSNIDLSTVELSAKLVESIRSDIHKHQLLVFKKQAQHNEHIIPTSKRIALAKKLGPIVSSHYHHPNAPHRDIFRVSNDRKYGCLNVGRTGWHIDGTFLAKPYNYSMMHIVSVPKRGFGQTAFISSEMAVHNVLHKSEEFADLKHVMNRLYMVGRSPNYVIHPVQYKHPATNKDTLLIHLGMTSSFIEIKEAYAQELSIDEALKLHESKGDVVKVYNEMETQIMLQDIESLIAKCKESGLMYLHEYEQGDLVVTDNLAVLHEAVPSTQHTPHQIGLRIMDRISIGGQFEPRKVIS